MVDGKVLQRRVSEGQPGGEAGGGEECVTENFELEFAREERELWECGERFHDDLVWI